MPSRLNQRIKDRREELGLTQEELAKAVQVSKATVSRWESSVIKEMRRDKLLLLAFTLETTVDYLVGATDDPRQKRDLTPMESEILIMEGNRGIFRNLVDAVGYRIYFDEDANAVIEGDGWRMEEKTSMVDNIMLQVCQYFKFLLQQEASRR